jgi:hypothetical protein
MDSTYANSVAILRHIFENEINFDQQQITRQLEPVEEQKSVTKVS